MLDSPKREAGSLSAVLVIHPREGPVRTVKWEGDLPLKCPRTKPNRQVQDSKGKLRGACEWKCKRMCDTGVCYHMCMGMGHAWSSVSHTLENDQGEWGG